MVKFRFRFESLLRHRRGLEDSCQRNLAQLIRTRMILHGELRLMQQELHDSKRQMANSLVGHLNVSRIHQFAAASQEVTNRGHQIVRRLADLEGQIEQARKALIGATRDRRGLDRLRERHLVAWKRVQGRRLDLELDEFATQRYVRESHLEVLQS